MSELIVSFYVESPHTAPIGLRLYDDGRVEDYRVSKLEKDASGGYSPKAVTPGWYPVVTLGDDALSAARQAVEDSGLRDLPAKIAGDGSQTSDPRRATWQVQAGGAAHTVQIDPWPTRAPEVQALVRLSQTLQELVQAALAGGP